MTINNNTTGVKAIGVEGNMDINVGTSGSGRFDHRMLPGHACREGHSLQCGRGRHRVALVGNQVGVVFDMPKMGLSNGQTTIEVNQPVTIALDMAAVRNDLGYTMRYAYFAYLPKTTGNTELPAHDYQVAVCHLPVRCQHGKGRQVDRIPESGVGVLIARAGGSNHRFRMAEMKMYSETDPKELAENLTCMPICSPRFTPTALSWTCAEKVSRMKPVSRCSSARKWPHQLLKALPDFFEEVRVIASQRSTFRKERDKAIAGN
ncbi:hypothetical protein [Stenotrophomonas phage CM2]